MIIKFNISNVVLGFPGGSAVKDLPVMQEPQELQILYTLNSYITTG